MSTKFDDNSPIISQQMFNILAESMSRLNPVYPIIMRIIIETDIPLTRLLEMKVSDIAGKTELSYEASKHREIIRTEPLSDELQSILNEYLADRDSDAYAFTGSRSGKKMHPEAFRLSLKNASAVCGFNPPANIGTLHKTYLYNTFKTDQQKARSHASSTSLKRFLDFIHVDSDVPRDRSEINVKERFYSSAILDKTTRLFTNTTQDISEKTQRPDTMPPEYFRHVLNLLCAIDSAIQTFHEKTST